MKGFTYSFPTSLVFYLYFRIPPLLIHALRVSFYFKCDPLCADAHVRCIATPYCLSFDQSPKRSGIYLLNSFLIHTLPPPSASHGLRHGRHDAAYPEKEAKNRDQREREGSGNFCTVCRALAAQHPYQHFHQSRRRDQNQKGHTGRSQIVGALEEEKEEKSGPNSEKADSGLFRAPSPSLK